MNVLASEGKSHRPETITAVNVLDCPACRRLLIRNRRRLKHSASPESCSQVHKDVWIVSITYQNCYGILLRRKGNSVKKRPKKIVMSVAAIYSHVMLSLKYVIQELSLNGIYVSHWSFGKSNFRIMRPVLQFGTLFFSKTFIAKS